MAKPSDTFRWMVLGVAVSLIMASIGAVQFVLEPLKTRIDVARQNLRAEFDRLERRFDSLDERLRTLEREHR